jgi:hypothetical protein
MPSDIYDGDAGIRHDHTATLLMRTVNKQLST